MTEVEFEAGQQVRLKQDPGRIGVVTKKIRDYGGARRLFVRFANGGQYVPEDQLEEIGPEGDDPLDLLERGRLGDAADLRRAVTHARLTGRLADVIYSMDTTGTDFYAHQFKPIVKLMNSVSRGILIADEVGLGKTIEAGLLWTELRTRFDFRRLLVLCPAMLRQKWQRELRQRFGVTADVLDAAQTLDRLRQAPSMAVLPRASPSSAVCTDCVPNRGWNEDDARTCQRSIVPAGALHGRAERARSSRGPVHHRRGALSAEPRDDDVRARASRSVHFRLHRAAVGDADSLEERRSLRTASSAG